MALADKVKGLSKHKIEVPPPAPAPVIVFDNAAADRLITETADAISAPYPVGCIEWLIMNRTEIWDALRDVEFKVDAAYLSCDLPALKKALDLCCRTYLKAYEVFNTRPPVIEVQADLAL